MSERAGISPYYTNHSLRATTVTVLSSINVETRKIKAVTGHRRDTSVVRYCERPILSLFKHMFTRSAFSLMAKTQHRCRLSHPQQLLHLDLKVRSIQQFKIALSPLATMKQTYSKQPVWVLHPFFYLPLSKDVPTRSTLMWTSNFSQKILLFPIHTVQFICKSRTFLVRFFTSFSVCVFRMSRLPIWIIYTV